VILFAGGNGALKLASGHLGGLGGNFLVRNRARFAEHGFMVAVPDLHHHPLESPRARVHR
jgi:hypothetical protein